MISPVLLFSGYKGSLQQVWDSAFDNIKALIAAGCVSLQ